MRRTYRSEHRKAQAAATRRKVIEAAATCFTEHGYVKTTLADIATTAQVSVQTVEGNGPKRGLLLAAFEQTFFGAEGQQAAMDRPERVAAHQAHTDPRHLIDDTARYIAQGAARTWPLYRALEQAAAQDPDAHATLTDLIARARNDLRRYIDLIAEKGGLRGDLDPQELTDRLDALLNPNVYGRLAEHAGWDTHHYTTYLADTMKDLLLKGPSARAGHGKT